MSQNDSSAGGSRNYYDDQFEGRINQIAQPGATPPAKSSGWGSGSLGTKGIGGGVILFVIIGIRVALMLARTTSSTPTYQYNPPPPITNFQHQQFDFDDANWRQKGWNDNLEQKPFDPQADPLPPEQGKDDQLPKKGLIIRLDGKKDNPPVKPPPENPK